MTKKTSCFQQKKGQITIFIIIGLIFVVLIVMAFSFFMKPTIIVSDENPGAYIEKCMKDSFNDVENILLEQGGSLNPGLYKFYNGKNVTYICYTKDFYKQCVMVQPLLVRHIAKEIENYSREKMENCFQTLKTNLLEKGYQVELGENMELTTELALGSVKMIIKRDLSVVKEDSKNFKEFRSFSASPLYDLAMVVQEIGAEEAKFCYFDYLGYMMLYNFDITRFQTGDMNKIYTISKKGDIKKMNVAVRSCALPQGL